MNDSPVTLEALSEKLDKLIDYQRKAHTLAILRGILSFILFFVLVILPMIWAYSLFKTFAGQLDFGKLAGQYSQISKGLDQLDSLGQLGEIGEQMKGTDLEGILNKVKP